MQPDSPTNRLLSSAVEYMRTQGHDCNKQTRLRISLTDVAEEISYTCTLKCRATEWSPVEALEMPETPPCSVTHWLWLSPTEKAIAESLLAKQSANPESPWLTAKEIADLTKNQPDTRFRVILANMVDRQIVMSSSRYGYRLSTETDAAEAS